MSYLAHFPLYIMAFGILVASLGVPWVQRRTITPLQERGFISKIKARLSRRELIVGAGPSMSLIVAGALIFFLGLLLQLSGV